MSDYKKIAEEALRLAKNKKLDNVINKFINESVVYPDGISERLHPQLEDELANRKHSLGKHPIFPEDDETTFEEKVIGNRFSEVSKRYKRAFDCDTINNDEVKKEIPKLLFETMGLESKHKKKLEKLAIKMIREEFDMGEDVVEIHAELTPHINMVGTKKNSKPVSNELHFKNHDEVINAKEEVYKRRFINAMIQGSAKKCNHMFHMVDEELTDLDPRLVNKYSKLMAAADYVYFIVPEMDNQINGGVVRVQFPSKTNPKAIIHVQAMVFPVLVHELVKGVMELISGHGLPKDKKLGEYVINKADFLAAEPWDMRLGPAIYSRFTEMIDPDDFNLKHHVYADLVSLPVKEFNLKMREIMAGTKDGKKIIDEIIKDVKDGLKKDEFTEAMDNINKPTKDDESINNVGFSWDELMGDNPSNNENDLDDGFNWEDLEPEL